MSDVKAPSLVAVQHAAASAPLALASPNRFVERMLTLDPNYGSQLHQRQMIERYEERQRRAPCALDHEHQDACYPKGLTDAVTCWQINITRAPATPHAWRTGATGTGPKIGVAAIDATGEHMVPWW